MLWIKISFTLFLLVLLPVNWVTYGPANILWISDVTLLLAYFAIVFESKLLSSMAALQGLVLESLWVLSFLASYFFSWNAELTAYMQNANIPLWIRCLSLFHIVLPPILIWLLYRFGYTKKALPIQIGITWIVLFLTWGFTSPAENINFVFSNERLRLDSFSYLLLLATGITCLIGLTHLLIRKTLPLQKR